MDCALTNKTNGEVVYALPGRQERKRRVESGYEDALLLGSAPGCDIILATPGVRPQHARMMWDSARATWCIENLWTPEELQVNSRPLAHGAQVPLLFESTEIQLGPVALGYTRQPEVPVLDGAPCHEVVLDQRPLVLGRKRDGAGQDTAERRLEMDEEIRLISSQQAVIYQEGACYFIEDRRHDPRYSTVLNGSQGFGKRQLVYGDRIQIPGFEYYTFVYAGGRLRHVGRRGLIQARGLCVDVPGRRILDAVDLDIQPGELVGILGGSGQGKSTLMNALCGLNPANVGEVRLDGVALSDRSRIAELGIGFVPQDDIVHAELVVEDAIRLSARLKLKLPAWEIEPLVDRTLKRLQLEEHRHKRIDILSGGQRKRVSIACELLTLPNVLFLDEPTSGLDPAIEGEFMDLLRRLASSGLTVVCTTHVLQNAHVFDKLAFIHGGQLVFYGDPYNAASFFLDSQQAGGADHPAVSPMGQTAQPALGPTTTALGTTDDSTDSSVTNTAVVATSTGRPRRQRLLSQLPRIYTLLARSEKPARQLADEFRRSVYASASLPPLLPPPPQAAGGDAARSNQVGYWRCLQVLLVRQWKVLSAHLMNLLFLAAQALVIGVLIGWVSDDLVLRMFLCVVATMWFGTSNGAQQIVGELPIFRRERVSGLGLNVYLHSKLSFFCLVTSVQALALLFTASCVAMAVHPRGTDDPDYWKKFRDDVCLGSNYVRKQVPLSVLPGKAREDAGGGKAEPKAEDAEADKLANELAAFLAEDLPDPKSTAASATSGSEPKTDKDYQGQDTAPTPEAQKQLAKMREATTFTTIHRGLPLFLIEATARLLDTRKNILDWTEARYEEALASATATNAKASAPIPWVRFLLVLWLQRLGALVAAALVGVAIGLAISSLVATPTQSVMWVPLILIPQILFGGFVVTRPEMTWSVRGFSTIVPSFNAQRMMDVSMLYGQRVPRIANDTKVPVFLGSLDEEKEKVKWHLGSQQGSQTALVEETYDKVSDRNKSWQNLTVLAEIAGQRKKEFSPGSGKSNDVDSVESRTDVLYRKDDMYFDLAPASAAASVLAIWIAASYVVTFFGLRLKQTGR